MSTVIYNSVKFNWFNIPPEKLKSSLKALGVVPYPINEAELIDFGVKAPSVALNIDEVYKGFCLYDLALYSICNDLIIFKNELDAEKHTQVIQKWFAMARYIIDHFTDIFTKNKFSLVVAVNGHSILDACLLAVAKAFGVPFLCIENTSNKNKIVWDDVTGQVITFNLSKTYFDGFKDKVAQKASAAYALNFKHTVFDVKKAEHLSNESNQEIPFAEPYVLFLAQVYCDAAQLFALNKGFKNPVEVMVSVVQICNDLKMPLVVKLHPKEIDGVSPVVEKPYGMPTYNRVKMLESNTVFIDGYNHYNTYRLIANSKMVITVNSQAGLEACLYDKPVLSYHNCFFSGKGFTYDYSNKESLNNTINHIITNNIEANKDLARSQKFFFIFFEKYCIENTIMSLLLRIVKSGDFSPKMWMRLLKFKIQIPIKKMIKPFMFKRL